MIPIKKILADFLQAILRFPIPILCSVFAFALFVFESHFVKSDGYVAKNFIVVKTILSSIIAISVFIAFDIYSEINKISKSSRLGFILLVFCILGLHFYTVTPAMFDNEQIFMSRYLIFAVIFHLMVSVSAYFKEKDLSRFWQFNHFLFIRFFTSVIFSITLILGLLSALWAVENLFGLDINSKFYTDIIMLIALIFNTLFFLMGVPKDYSFFSNTIEYKKALRIFVQYILIPIIGIYFVILYFYLFKIVFLQKIPNGWVCIPILIFSIIGILAYLLIYPIRNDRSNPIIFVFAKYFYFVLLPLLSLYFIAIILRIKPYGITEDRYLIFILGVWLLIISLYIIISKRDNIIIIPTSLIVILFLSAIGPWGMFQLSVQNQLLRLEKNLKRNHVLINKEIKSDKSNISFSETDAKSIHSILQFLYKRDELDKVKKWIPEKDLNKLKLAIDSNQLYRLYEVFGLKDNQIENESHLIYVHSNEAILTNSIDMNGFQHIQQFSTYKNENEEQVCENSFNIDSNQLLILKRNSNAVNVSLDSVLSNIKIVNKENTFLNDESSFNPKELKIDSLQLSTDSFKIIFTNIEIEKIDSNLNFKQINGYYLY